MDLAIAAIPVLDSHGMAITQLAEHVIGLVTAVIQNLAILVSALTITTAITAIVV